MRWIVCVGYLWGGHYLIPSQEDSVPSVRHEAASWLCIKSCCLPDVRPDAITQGRITHLQSLYSGKRYRPSLRNWTCPSRSWVWVRQLNKHAHYLSQSKIFHKCYDESIQKRLFRILWIFFLQKFDFGRQRRSLFMTWSFDLSRFELFNFWFIWAVNIGRDW